MKILEELEKAVDGLNFVAGDLREALTKADAVAGILLLDIIGQVAVLKASLSTLQNAIISDNKEEAINV